MAESGRPIARLGRVEAVVLDVLRLNHGLTPRDQVVLAAFPSLATGSDEEEPAAARGRRARAEAAVSRALVSLERKGLVIRDRNEVTGRTMIRTPSNAALPGWEQMARAEEDLAVHFSRLAREWEQLALRARRRAVRIRADRSEAAVQAERASDLDAVARLEGTL